MLDTHAAPEATRDDVDTTYTAPTQDRWEPLFLVNPKADRTDLVDFVNIVQECLDDLLSEGTEGGWTAANRRLCSRSCASRKLQWAACSRSHE